MTQRYRSGRMCIASTAVEEKLRQRGGGGVLYPTAPKHVSQLAHPVGARPSCAHLRNPSSLLALARLRGPSFAPPGQSPFLLHPSRVRDVLLQMDARGTAGGVSTAEQTLGRKCGPICVRRPPIPKKRDSRDRKDSWSTPFRAT